MLGAEHRSAFAAIVSEHHVLTGLAMEAYETPARYERGRAAAVVRPGSTSSGLRAAGHVLGFDLAFDRGRVLAFRRAMSEELARHYPEYRVCDFGHLGDGGVHFSLLRERSSDFAKRDQAVSDFVFDAAITRFDGSFSGEHGIGRANQRIYDRYTSALRQHLAHGLTQLFGVANLGAVRFGPQAHTPS